MRTTAAGAAAVLAVLAWGELEYWRASWRLLGDRPDVATTPDTPRGAPDTVVVLGYRNAGARANAINRRRVRAALRTCGPDTRLVCTGGPVASAHPEAQLLAAEARRRGFRGRIDVETASRSTWENVEHCLPLLGDADAIAIVSDSPHAATARRYLWHQNPTLARRLVRGADYRFGEWILLKPLVAALARIHAARER